MDTTTTTISLPRTLARRARRLSKIENRTMSELFREAFRVYEAERMNTHRWGRRESPPSWAELRRTMEEFSRLGRKRSLSAFVIRDRRSH